VRAGAAVRSVLRVVVPAVVAAVRGDAVAGVRGRARRRGEREVVAARARAGVARILVADAPPVAAARRHVRLGLVRGRRRHVHGRVQRVEPAARVQVVRADHTVRAV
jgi:hypothetical protein